MSIREAMAYSYLNFISTIYLKNKKIDKAETFQYEYLLDSQSPGSFELNSVNIRMAIDQQTINFALHLFEKLIPTLQLQLKV